MLATSLRFVHFAVMVALAAPFHVASAYAAIQAEGAAATTVAFDDLEIALELPKLDGLTAETSPLPTAKGAWKGRLGASEVWLSLHALPQETYDFFEPEDVIETWRDSMRNPENVETKDTTLTFEPIRCVAGPAVGCTPILATVEGLVQKKSDPATNGSVFLAAALLPKHGWLLRADCIPPLDAEAMRNFTASLEKCVTYKGKPCDPRWTDEEARMFWQRIAPEPTWKKYEKPTRTKHFIVLTNSTSPGPFVKKLEGWYSSIAKIVPTDELEGRKLLPIVLFRTDDDFQNFYRAYHKLGMKEEVKETSVGLGDWVATSMDYDNEYERLVDLCKQTMIVRARAWGANLWFRSGLREYCASKPRERAAAYKAVKKKRYTSIEKLFDDSAWEAQGDQVEKTGTSDEASYWDQAALWIEFFHEGPWPKDSFARFVRTVGCVPKGNSAEVAAAIESIYGMDMKALEKKWVEYYAKK